MSTTISPTTKKRYGLQRVCKVWKTPRSTVYSNRQLRNMHGPKRKRGPCPPLSDVRALELIKKTIDGSPFHGEGHRKVHARIRRLLPSTPLGRDRVRRIMGHNRLLSPFRVPLGKAKAHNGRITTDEPNVMWGTDAAKILTLDDGWVWFFGVIEHWNSECLGWRLVKKGDRFAAIDALSEALKKVYGSVDTQVAGGVELRMDHGSQFKSDAFLKQARYWGVTPSPGIVREPETNGVIERFHRTFKEQIIHGRIYRDIEELRCAVHWFIETYNDQWLLEKLGYLSPREARQKWASSSAA